MSDKRQYWFLIRGWIRHHGHWHGFCEALSESLRAMNPGQEIEVIPLDLLGNGTFCQSKSPRHIRQQADHLMKLIHQYPIDEKRAEVFLLGISMAGIVILELIAKWVEQVQQRSLPLKGVVMINSSVKGVGRTWQRLRVGTWGSVARSILLFEPKKIEKVIMDITVNEQQLRSQIYHSNLELLKRYPYTRENALNQLLSAQRYQPRWARLDQANIPTLILASKGDRLVQCACSELLAQQLDAPIYLHESAGHDLTLEAGSWVIEMVHKWRKVIPD